MLKKQNTCHRDSTWLITDWPLSLF